MTKIHPNSKGIAKNYIKLAPINIWRSKNGTFYECSNNLFNQYLEELINFDLESYKNIIRQNNKGILPDGYYYANHQTQKGNYLGTDDYAEAMKALMDRGLVQPA